MNTTQFQSNTKGRLTSSWFGFAYDDAVQSASGHLHQWSAAAHAFADKLGAAIHSTFSRFTSFLSRKHTSSLRVTWAGVLRSDSDHLVPESNDEMRFKVANQMYLQEEGQCLVFDDKWNAEAWQNLPGYRVVFSAGARE